MGFINILVTIYSILFCLVFCIICVQSIYNSLKLTLFEEAHPPIPDTWPKLSIVIAACNEAASVEKAVSTLLDQDYPSMEIILVNDRSTDNTGEIIDRLAKRDKRITPVHISDLPSGWLGKVYAVHVGTQKTHGDWILYTDADIFYKKGVLRKAMALALSKNADHLTVVPKPTTSSFWLETAIHAFGIMFIQGTGAAKVDDPESNAFVGAGAFNMVKKSTLGKTQGFQWLRMEVADDVGLGLMLKRAGAISAFAVSIKEISLTWYETLGHMFKGLEKNLFGVSTQYNYLRMILMAMLLWLTFSAPFVAVLYSRVRFLPVFGFTAGFILLISALVGKFRFKQRFLTLLLTPIGHILISFMLLYSGIMCKRRGGIIWRGTKYTIHDLRAGQRVKFSLLLSQQR